MTQPWQCCEARDIGYQDDKSVAVIQIPSGFCVTSSEIVKASAVIREVEDGDAVGTTVKAFTELDDDQLRRCSPRAWITLDGLACRGLAEMRRGMPLDEEEILRLWGIYQDLRKELTAYLDTTFFFFSKWTPTLWYKRVDAELKLEPILRKRYEHGSHRKKKVADMPEETLVAVEIDNRDESCEIEVSANDNTSGAPTNSQNIVVPQLAKRSKVECVVLGGEHDPFLKNVSTLPRNSDGSGMHNGSGGGKQHGQREISTVASDFRALRRFNERVRTRILGEGPWRFWYTEIVKLGRVNANIDDVQLDEIWVWLMALQQSPEESPVELDIILEELARSTMRASTDRLRPTLARLLCVFRGFSSNGVGVGWEGRGDRRDAGDCGGI